MHATCTQEQLLLYCEDAAAVRTSNRRLTCTSVLLMLFPALAQRCSERCWCVTATSVVGKVVDIYHNKLLALLWLCIYCCCTTASTMLCYDNIKAKQCQTQLISQEHCYCSQGLHIWLVRLLSSCCTCCCLLLLCHVSWQLSW